MATRRKTPARSLKKRTNSVQVVPADETDSDEIVEDDDDNGKKSDATSSGGSFEEEEDNLSVSSISTEGVSTIQSDSDEHSGSEQRENSNSDFSEASEDEGDREPEERTFVFQKRFTFTTGLKIKIKIPVQTWNLGDTIPLQVKVFHRTSKPTKACIIYLQTLCSSAKFKNKMLNDGLQEFNGENRFPLYNEADIFDGLIEYTLPSKLSYNIKKKYISQYSQRLVLDFPTKRTFGYDHILCSIPINLNLLEEKTEEDEAVQESQEEEEEGSFKSDKGSIKSEKIERKILKSSNSSKESAAFRRRSVK